MCPSNVDESNNNDYSLSRPFQKVNSAVVVAVDDDNGGDKNVTFIIMRIACSGRIKPVKFDAGVGAVSVEFVL